MNELIRTWIESARILELRCPCKPCGCLSVFGLPYRAPAWDAMRTGDDACDTVVVVVDADDLSKVLLREPTCGWLLSARCLEPHYITGLTFWEHLERLARARPSAIPALERMVVEALGQDQALQPA